MSRGWWRYSLNNAAPAVQSLDAAETVEDTFPLTASDGSVQTVTISIAGAEDAPVLTLTRVNKGLSITLECAGHHLSASDAVSLLSEFAGRMEQPLRHLL